MSQVGWTTCPNSPEKELTWPSPVSPQLELGVPTLKHDVLEKVDLTGCAIEWDPKDQQEVRKILREYTDVFGQR